MVTPCEESEGVGGEAQKREEGGYEVLAFRRALRENDEPCSDPKANGEGDVVLGGEGVEWHFTNGRAAFLRADLSGGGMFGEDLLRDGLDLFVGDLEEVLASFLRRGDVVVEEESFTSPTGVGGSGFEGEF